MSPSVRMVKRVVDIAGALAGILLSAPLAVPIAIAIVVESPGPVFVKQKRLGWLFGRETDSDSVRAHEFTMRKFRSMYADAERVTGPVLASKHDPRITRVGRFLRATRLDELPQFWNVLVGDMSLVGPRPERPELMTSLSTAIPFFEERTRGVKPGLTGLAQVCLDYSGAPLEGSPVQTLRASLTNPFRIAEAEGALADDLRLKLMFDLAYAASVENFWLYLATDLKVIVQTPWVMLAQRGR